MRGTHSVGLAGFSVCFLVNALGAQPLFLGGAIPLPGDDSSPYSNRIACPRELLIDDLNGDGLPELLVAYSYGVEIRVGLSQSPGKWATPEVVGVLPEEFTLIDLVTGDVDGDGFEDIAYTADTVFGSTLRFGSFFAQPGGTFTEVPALEVEASDIGVVFLRRWASSDDFLSLGDVTGDGLPDLVVPGESLFIMAGDGAGGFGDPEIISSDLAVGAALVDADNDGIAEVLATARNASALDSRIVLWKRGVQGWVEVSSIDTAGRLTTFAPRVYSFAFSDDASLTPGTRVYVVEFGASGLVAIDIAMDGTMTYGPSPTQLGPTPFEYGAIGDVAGGPAPDLVFANGTAMVDLTADGFGEFEIVDRYLSSWADRGGAFGPHTCRQVEIRDVNADGQLDVVMADPLGMRVLYGKQSPGGGKALASAPFFGSVPGDSVAAIATGIGDLNGDGLPDVVSSSIGFYTTAHFQRNDGTFEPVRVRNDGSPRVLVVDIDGDGFDDVLGFSDSMVIDIRYSDGAGSFPESTQLALGGYFVELRTGDVDGDDRLEIIAEGIRNLAVYTPSGARSFEPLLEEIDGARSHYGVDVGDLDGDGFDDIVVGGGEAQAVYTVYFSRGDGTFESPISGPSIDGTSIVQSVALGDLDGDGDLDLAVAGEIGRGATAEFARHVVVYENDGSGSFVNETPLPPDDANDAWTLFRGEYLRMADADGDGDLDIFVATDDSYPLVVHRPSVEVVINDGAFGFHLEWYYGVGIYRDESGFVNQFDVADVTGDGRPDIVVPETIVPLDASDTFDGLTGFRLFENIATPRTICPADFADPAGELDPADLSAFVAAFLGGNPDTDLAAPFGILDLDDIVAFVAAFLDGCD